MHLLNRRIHNARGNVAGKNSVIVTVDGAPRFFVLTPELVTEIHNDVIRELFGVSEPELPAHRKKASRVRQLYREMRIQMQQLYSVETPHYLGTVRRVAELSDKLDLAAQDYKTDSLTSRFDNYASGIPWFVPKPLRGTTFVRKFFTNTQAAVNRNSGDVIECFSRTTANHLRRWLNLPDKSRITIDASSIQRFYQPIVDAVGLSQLYKCTPGIRKFLQETLRVGTEGSSEAASLYYRWTSGFLLADETVPLENRVDWLLRGLSAPLINIRLSDSSKYITAFQIGIFGVLAALDVENKRRMESSGLINRIFRSLGTYDKMISKTSELADILLEMYVDPACASELIRETPVGHRHRMLSSLKKKPEVVALFDQLREEGVGARLYMAFLEQASSKVAYDGEKMDRYAFVQQLVQGKRQNNAAAWIVMHPEFWNPDGLETRLGIAAGSRSPELRLGMLQEWHSYNGVQKLIVEMAKFPDKRILSLAAQLRTLPQEILGRINPENFEQTIAEYHNQLSQKSGAARAPQDDSWIDAIYPGNSEPNTSLHSAHSRLRALGAGNRLQRLHDYAAETLSEQEQGAAIMQCALAIKRMPDHLLSSIMHDPSLFSGNKSLEALTAYLSNPQSVGELIDIHNSGGNAHNYLSNHLRAEQQHVTPVPMEALKRKVGVTSDLPVRIVVLGQVTPRLQEFVAARLNDTNIRVVYVDETTRGSTLPSSSPAIVYTLGIGHSSRAYGGLVHGNELVRASNGGLTGLVRDIRNLASEMRAHTLVEHS